MTTVKREMREIFEKNKKLCYLICIIIIAMLSVPPIFVMKSAGLDPSWMYAINSFRNKGFVFGKDFVSTYGPLGFIIYCQNVGYNMVIATLIWIGAIFVHIVLLYQLLLKKAENNKYMQFTMPSGLHSVLERPFSEANGRPFLVKRSPLIVC